jgi:hypothetical protein
MRAKRRIKHVSTTFEREKTTSTPTGIAANQTLEYWQL